jgi:ketosteroid isomerase-like protein
MSNNIDTVKQIYESWGRHDVPEILSKLAEDVEWEYGIAQLNVAPWLRELKGRDAVPAFFEALAPLDMSLFQTKLFFESENIVIALLDAQWTHKDTGKFVDNQDAIHIWHFNPEGMVVKFGHRVDTHSHWLAAQKD